MINRENRQGVEYVTEVVNVCCLNVEGGGMSYGAKSSVVEENEG